jgi:hypothetical protein
MNRASRCVFSVSAIAIPTVQISAAAVSNPRKTPQPGSDGVPRPASYAIPAKRF